MRCISISTFIAFFMILAAPQPAGASGMGDYLPWPFGGDAENKPQNTLEAPFRDEMDSQQKSRAGKGDQRNELMKLYEKQRPEHGSTSDNVDQRHRSDQQIAMWVMEKVSNALSFKSGNIDKHLKTLESFFTASAYQTYRKSLGKQELLKNIRNHDLRMNALVEEDPFLTEEGSDKGVYKWHFKVPVMVSYIKPGASRAGNRQAMSKKLIVRLTVSRKQESKQEEGVMIARWQMDAAN